MEVEGGKIWYEVYGDGPQPPVILLHGGPGGTSLGFEPLKDLGYDGPMIFLDQLGSGRSDALSDTSLMTLEHYVDQVERLRAHLGYEQFILYGHSWGTMLGIAYWEAYPKRVQAMVMSSPLFSTQLWIQDAERLIATLPDSLQQAIRIHEANQDYSHPAYLQAVEAYYGLYVRRKERLEVDRSYLNLASGEDIYMYMWGPSEFSSTGTLKHFDKLELLPQIPVPVLLMAGEYDEAQPSTVRYYQSLIPNARFEEIPDAAHSTLNDNRTATLNAVRRFLGELKKSL
jgi:proline iminopeptidase